MRRDKLLASYSSASASDLHRLPSSVRRSRRTTRYMTKDCIPLAVYAHRSIPVKSADLGARHPHRDGKRTSRCGPDPGCVCQGRIRCSLGGKPGWRQLGDRCGRSLSRFFPHKIPGAPLPAAHGPARSKERDWFSDRGWRPIHEEPTTSGATSAGYSPQTMVGTAGPAVAVLPLLKTSRGALPLPGAMTHR